MSWSPCAGKKSAACSSFAKKCLISSFTANGSRSLFAGTWTDGIFRSDDGGRNWSSANSGLPDKNIEFIIPNGKSNLFAVTRSNGVFLSTSNGDQWTLFNTGLNAKINHIIMDSLYLFAGTFYEGVWRTPRPQGIVGIDNTSLPLTADYLSTSMYLSGTTGSATAITLSLARTVQVSGAVYDLSGQTVTTLINKRLVAGTHYLTWNYSNVPVGCYMIRIQAGKDNCVKLISVVR